MSRVIAIDGARIINGKDSHPITDGIILIKDKKIVDLGSRGEVDVPSDAEIIDVKGKTILPGLIDAHIHYTGLRTGDIIKESLLTPYSTLVARAIKDLEATLNAGFTTICDAGGEISLHLKQAVEEGTVIGPRIIASGYPLSQTFGHGDIHFFHPKLVDARETPFKIPFSTLLCDGADECRKAARYALREGADFIKIFATGGVFSQRDRPEYPQFTVSEIKAIVEEAERADKFVHAHAEGAEGIKNALLAGVKVIAHGDYIDDDGVNLAIEKKALLIPTLSISKLTIEYGVSAGMPEWALEKQSSMYNITVSNIKKAYRAGVLIATGTDFFLSIPDHPIYGVNSMELSLLVNEIGMKPMEAIVAATRNASLATGMENDIGVLEKGRIADLVVVDGDPLKDITILKDLNRIVGIVKEGTIIKMKK